MDAIRMLMNVYSNGNAWHTERETEDEYVLRDGQE